MSYPANADVYFHKPLRASALTPSSSRDGFTLRPSRGAREEDQLLQIKRPLSTTFSPQIM